MDRTSLKNCPLGLALRTLADSEAPQAGEYYFTCLSLKSQAVEKKRRDQCENPPGHRGQEGKEKGPGVEG